jgi:hypothetical protein
LAMDRPTKISFADMRLPLMAREWLQR